MNCKCCGAWFSSSDSSQELCAACRRALERVSPIIESLSAELEATEAIAALARGLEVERDQLKARLEHVEYERDAAVRALTLWNCFSCKHAGYAHSEVCASCIYNRNRIAKGYVSGKNRYEWRGVKEDVEWTI